MKILLIAGHGEGDPGAGGNGLWEADLTREVVTLLKPKLAEICDVDVADTSKNWYEYLKRNSFSFKGYDYVLEVHFNAYNKEAHGTEIIVTPSEQNTGVEAAILKQLCAAGDFMNR
ncbi:MAG: N-acetylmuramoyl-L-alanine amidase, partial [Clostridia bacterium]|nr:N-acetylmuramoyl-L-alanine amidase [Clostridia bacterium]